MATGKKIILIILDLLLLTLVLPMTWIITISWSMIGGQRPLVTFRS
ncbi:hypothetical protein OBG91_15135 [Lactococcus lactis]|nr:hypothetical protein [Lactococcus lactis]